MEALSKFRVPVGSLLVDSALVVALLFGLGQQTQALDEVARRVAAIERVDSASRTAVLERRMDIADRDRDEVLAYLKRIEDKLDRKADR